MKFLLSLLIACLSVFSSFAQGIAARATNGVLSNPTITGGTMERTICTNLQFSPLLNTIFQDQLQDNLFAPGIGNFTNSQIGFQVEAGGAGANESARVDLTYVDYNAAGSFTDFSAGGWLRFGNPNSTMTNFMVDTSGNVRAQTYYGDGSHLTGISGGGGSAGVASVSSGTTFTIDCSTTNRWKITLTGNATITVTNLAFGSTALLMVHQDNTGARTLTGDGKVQFASLPLSGVTSAGSNQFPLNTNAYALDIFAALGTETNTIITGAALGYARANSQ